MDLYSKKTKNKSRHIMLFSFQILILIGSLLVVLMNNKGIFQFTDRKNLHLLILLVFNFLTALRFIFTLFIFMKRQIPFEELFSVLFAFLFYYIGFILLALFGSGFSIIPVIVGSILFITGLLFNTISEWQRHRFKNNPANQGHLFTKGLFGISRHPNYLGDILWVTAYAVVSANPFSYIIPLLLFLFFFFYNIPLQEKHLSEKYGNEFEDYCKQTKALVPFVL